MRAAATFSASNRTIDAQPIALGAIADLIVVLDEDHEVAHPEVGRSRPRGRRSTRALALGTRTRRPRVRR